MIDGNQKPERTLTVFALVMITTGIITSIHGAPSMAEYGFSLVFIYLFVAIVFLMPSALISAELATGWPEDGGVYVWVKQAFGERMGFVAVWQQWIENVIWFPSILTVTVVAATYGFDPELKDNNWFIFYSVNGLFWILTVTNLFGMRTSGAVATICTIFGRIVPILFMMTLALIFLSKGNPAGCEFSWGEFIPNLTNTDKLSFIVGAFLTFAGIEASASNAASAKNPRRDYPIAIIFSACIALVLVTLIALAIAIVVPAKEINLDAGIMQAIEMMFATTGISMMVPVAGLIIALGMIGEVNNWIPAPTRGLLVAGKDGTLAPFWQRENKHAVHQRILLFQGIIFSSISTIYLFFDVQIAFWLMNVVPTMLYIIMYFLMFATGVRLRYTHPDVPRRYRVPFGNVGMWLLAVVGSAAGTVAIVFAFIPPGNVPDDMRFSYITVVIVGFVVFTALPFAIYATRKPQWRSPSSDAATAN
ncbi:MAG: amino acid permease [Pirellulales bacterium]|nr:amino acid permease [Pirellulales bacterium]